VKPIVLCVTATSSYRLLRIVAAELARLGRPVAYLLGPSPNLDAIRAEASQMGIAVYELPANPVGTARPVLRNHPRPREARIVGVLANLLQAPRFANRVFAGITRRIWRSDLYLLRQYRDSLASQLAAAIALLRTIDPMAVVVSEDGISAPLPVLTAARELGKPVVDVPYGYGVQRDLDISLEAKERQGVLVWPKGLCGLIIRKLIPHWIKRGHYAGVLMFPPPYIVAAESLGMTLRDAWIVHGGYSDLLCAESEQMRDLYLSEGIPPKKIVLTGTPYCDTLLNAFTILPAAKAALRQPHKIVAGRTRILVAWPPSYHDERGAQSEFASYREMTMTILGWLSSLPNCDVTVSLHPATLEADREALLYAGVVLSGAYVIDLIAAHDVFVTYFSSTIRWAIASGKPVVNYDAYKLHLDVYDAAPGVMTVHTFAALQASIRALADCETAFAKAANQQIAVAEYWGRVDGANTARILGEIDRLAAGR
jgi:hypothetical protein